MTLIRIGVNPSLQAFLGESYRHNTGSQRLRAMAPSAFEVGLAERGRAVVALEAAVPSGRLVEPSSDGRRRDRPPEVVAGEAIVTDRTGMARVGEAVRVRLA